MSRMPFVFLLVFLVVGGPALAQEPVDGDRPAAPITAPAEVNVVPDLSLLTDRPFGRVDYDLGPGDVVTVTTSGSIHLSYSLSVSPEGRLLMPTVGIVNVLGLNLDEAEALVRTEMLRFYRDIDVFLSLDRLRSFKVFVVGAVPNPGPRIASAATRVSEVLDLPFDPRGVSAVNVLPEQISQRNVLVVREGRDTLDVDLVRFQQTGDLEFNPALKSGDIVVVPGFDKTVEVYGRFFFPGTYEYRPGETLAELIRVANGYRAFPSDAYEELRLSRFISKNEREFHEFSVVEASGERGQDFVLRPSDAIYVAVVSDFKIQKTAGVSGQVLHQGIYPIRPDTTTIRDLVEMAGGLRSNASLATATLTRTPDDPEAGLEELLEIPTELLTDDERRTLAVRRGAGETNVVIDFLALFVEGEDVYNVTLQDGDRLRIPELREEVTVLGAVGQPGIVPHEPGRSIDYFIDVAGGYTSRADRGKVTLLKGRQRSSLSRGDVESIDQGDTIIVPFRTPIHPFVLFQTTIATFTGLSAIVLAFIAATRR